MFGQYYIWWLSVPICLTPFNIRAWFLPYIKLFGISFAKVLDLFHCNLLSSQYLLFVKLKRETKSNSWFSLCRPDWKGNRWNRGWGGKLVVGWKRCGSWLSVHQWWWSCTSLPKARSEKVRCVKTWSLAAKLNSHATTLTKLLEVFDVSLKKYWYLW